MDRATFEELMEDAPKFNQKLVEGLAVSEMQHIEEHIDKRIFKVAAAEFPPQLEYVRGERCGVEETLMETKKRQERQKKATYEMAPSDMYLMKYLFTFEGKPLPPLYLMLPYVRQAGMLRIRGSLFHIMPVIADRSFSVGTDSIFLQVSRARMNFSRMSYTLRVEGVREPQYMVHAKLHNKPGETGRGRNPLNNLKTTMAHYLFAQYGVYEVFRRYCNVEVVFGYADEINHTTYPSPQWVICSSFHDDPKVVQAPEDRRIRVAVRNLSDNSDKYYLNTGLTRATLSMLAGFYYLVDHFPERFEPEYIQERDLWIVLLGQLLFGSNTNVGLLQEGVMAHLNSLDNALDPEARDNLHKIGVECENLFDVLANLNETFTDRVNAAVRTVQSMYGKQLMILRYVLSDLAQSVNKFMFQVSKDANNRKRPLNAADIDKLLKRHIKWDVLYKISGSKHGEVVSVSCPGDNMLFKLTSQTVLQSESNGPRSRTGTAKGRGGVDASMLLDVSIATHGSYNTMSKSEPSGRNKLNPYGTFTSDGLLYQDPKFSELLDPIQELIQR